MILSEPTLARLRSKYTAEAEVMLPDILQLERNPELADELPYLDELIRLAPTSAQRGWLSRLLSEESSQHIGAWFEIMLFGWLRSIGPVEVEPSIEGDHPDFVVALNGRKIAVEARAVLIGEEERKQNAIEAEVINALQAVRRPFALEVQELQLRQRLHDISSLQQSVVSWLDGNHSDQFCYEVPDVIRIELSVIYSSDNLNHIGIIRSSDAQWVNSEPLKRPLREKAGQHKSLRRAGYPYVIALYLEPWQFSAEEIVEAWLGRETVVVDVESRQVVDQRLDLTGIHFSGAELRHRSVSGTLVFRSTATQSALRRSLKSSYIENPYASHPLPVNLFPCSSRFVVKEKTSRSYRMAWEAGASELLPENSVL